MISRLPTAEEINVFDSLDERCAVEHFLGKDFDQAKALFRDNFLYYQEDLMWMGPKAFRFYLPAAINYLLGTESDGDSDAAGSFYALIEFRMDCDPAEMEVVGPVVREGIRGILEDFDRYHCDSDIAARHRTLLSRLGA